MFNKFLNIFGLITLKEFKSRLLEEESKRKDLEQFYLNNLHGKEFTIDKLKKDVDFFKNVSKLNKKVSLHDKNYLKQLRSALSEINDLQNEKLKNWSKRVREVGQCDICESEKYLTAHHLWDKHTHPTLAYQDENGVCLCRTCHEGFHKEYTQKSQTTPALYKIYKIKRLNSLT